MMRPADTAFWAHLCTLHGRLICIALRRVCLSLCLSLCLSVTRQKVLDKFSYLEKYCAWVKPCLKVMILAGGLTPTLTSSCIFWPLCHTLGPFFKLPPYDYNKWISRYWSLLPLAFCNKYALLMNYNEVYPTTFCLASHGSSTREVPHIDENISPADFLVVL